MSDRRVYFVHGWMGGVLRTYEVCARSRGQAVMLLSQRLPDVRVSGIRAF